MMNAMTEQNMINAFGGESMASMRYSHFAARADEEKFPNVSRLFKAISYAEFVHAGDHYRVLAHLKGGFVANSMGAFGPGDTLKNLGLAIAGESFEIEQMYPAYIEVAVLQKEEQARRSFEWSYNTEKMHLELFQRAERFVKDKKDPEFGPIQVCEVCGYTLEGDAPDECPLCKAKKEMFKSFK
jgi:rubrerythrin